MIGIVALLIEESFGRHIDDIVCGNKSKLSVVGRSKENIHFLNRWGIAEPTLYINTNKRSALAQIKSPIQQGEKLLTEEGRWSKDTIIYARLRQEGMKFPVGWPTLLRQQRV